MLDEHHSEYPQVDDYARRVGIGDSVDPIKQVDLRPRARMAFVGGVVCVNTDERILDLVAQRITVVAFGPRSLIGSEPAASGITCVDDSDTNSGCKILMGLATDQEQLAAAQIAAARYAERRDVRTWSTTMSVATSGRG